MFVTKLGYCDFVVQSKNYVYIERVTYDNTFCEEGIKAAKNFHNCVIKPEPLARYFTRKGGSEEVETWCICRKPDDGRPMLQCENLDCVIKWYHFDCVKIVTVPEILWFCKYCI